MIGISFDILAVLLHIITFFLESAEKKVAGRSMEAEIVT